MKSSIHAHDHRGICIDEEEEPSEEPIETELRETAAGTDHVGYGGHVDVVSFGGAVGCFKGRHFGSGGDYVVADVGIRVGA